MADLLDEVVAALPDGVRGRTGGGGPRRVALVGKPNVGKSSLLNRLAGDERSVVHDVAGTTVDPVDSLIELDGKTWRFVDTAGLRRKVGQASGHEFYASVRTHGAIDAAEVVDRADRRLAAADRAGPAGAVDGDRGRPRAGAGVQQVGSGRRGPALHCSTGRSTASWCRCSGRSGSTSRRMTGRAVQKLVPAMETALESWDTRISTGRLNTWIKEVVAATPPPVRGGKQPRILFATQATARPPTFVLFTTGFLEAGYRRFLERRLRETFGFEGTPIRINVRVREKRGARLGELAKCPSPT